MTVQCLGQTFAIQQLAYTILQLVKALRPSGGNAAAYRLTFATQAQPENTAVPARWKTLRGRGKEERAFWSSNITLYFKVSSLCPWVSVTLGTTNRYRRKRCASGTSCLSQGGLWMQIVQEVE